MTAELDPSRSSKAVEMCKLSGSLEVDHQSCCLSILKAMNRKEVAGRVSARQVGVSESKEQMRKRSAGSKTKGEVSV
jgi:hypothetical protein